MNPIICSRSNGTVCQLDLSPPGFVIVRLLFPALDSVGVALNDSLYHGTNRRFVSALPCAHSPILPIDKACPYDMARLVKALERVLE
jgi:hypothetical protein